MKCRICNQNINGLDIRYSAYCQKCGKEIIIHVCEKCDRHPNHVMHIVEAIVNNHHKEAVNA